jgi:hypothetical protein
MNSATATEELLPDSATLLEAGALLDEGATLEDTAMLEELAGNELELTEELDGAAGALLAGVGVVLPDPEATQADNMPVQRSRENGFFMRDS